jgi:hypothetical protein
MVLGALPLAPRHGTVHTERRLNRGKNLAGDMLHLHPTHSIGQGVMNFKFTKVLI